MKKRLLITSIVMMLVCAVALSTATYAWFTSNTTVSASTMTLKAATSDKSALGIGWTGKTAGTYIVSNINEILQPMAPDIYNGASRGALTDNETTYELASGNQKFYTSNIKQEGSYIEFSNVEYRVNPVVYTELASDATKDTMTGTNSNSFYVVNMSTANVLDSVVVSGVFTDYDNVTKDRYIMVDTSVAPTQGVKYYLKNSNGGYDEIVDDANAEPAKTDRTDLQTHGFDNEKTYYIRQSLYVATSDAKFKEDTTYYTKSGNDYIVAYNVGDAIAALSDPLYDSNSTNYPTSDTVIAENKTYYTKDGSTYTAHNTVKVGANVPEDTYYELRDENGDDMIRVAIFTQEYRFTDDTTADPDELGKKYYKFNPSTGILGQYNVAQGADIEGLKLLELKSDKHKLRGVIGKDHTRFTSASGKTYDMNEVYYVEGSKVAVDVSEGTFADLKDVLFTYDGSQYKAISSDNNNNTYDPNATYYKQSYTKVAEPDEDDIDTYFTASYTTVNGQIEINKKVKDMNYYTNVNKSIDLATDLMPGEVVDIIAVIWLDGNVLDDTRSDEYAQVSLKFDSFRTNHSSQNAQH